MNRYYYSRLDECLKMFENTSNRKIPRNILFDPEGAPEDWERALGFLVEKGLLKDCGTYFEKPIRDKLSWTMVDSESSTAHSVSCFIVPS